MNSSPNDNDIVNTTPAGNIIAANAIGQEVVTNETSDEYELLHYQDDTVAMDEAVAATAAAAAAAAVPIPVPIQTHATTTTLSTPSDNHEYTPYNSMLINNNEYIQQAEFQPLSGSAVYIITNTSKNDKVGNVRTLQLMEERESIGCGIECLGGRWVARLDQEDGMRTMNNMMMAGSITHAIWIPGEEEEYDARGKKKKKKKSNQLSHLSNEALVKLSTCQTMNIPIVKPSWLLSIGELSPGQHWSEVDLGEHTPSILHVLEQMNSSWDGAVSRSKKEHNPVNHSIRNSVESNQSNGSDNSRRDAASSLSASICDTFQSLTEENPELMEEEALKRACELSMLDFAIVHHTKSPQRPSSQRGYTTLPNNDGEKGSSSGESCPHYMVLQIEQTATPDEIKAAYRRRALETHPDKGGKPGEFEAVARAYRILLNASNNSDNNNMLSADSTFDVAVSLKSTSHWDSELKEHRLLVREMYQNHGQDLDANIDKQNFILGGLGLQYREAGTKTRNEKNELIRNSCFYLSLACSYLGGIGALTASADEESSDVEMEDASGVGSDEDENSDYDMALLRDADGALIMETALTLKRTIEAAVLSAHPEWAAKGMVGEEVQAFSDFLVYTLESQTIISEWAVVVFDTSSGFVDVYRGKNYKDEACADESSVGGEGGGSTVTETYAASNTLTLRYTPGHYQPLVAAASDSVRPSLKKIIKALDEVGVLYVVTDGAAD